MKFAYSLLLFVTFFSNAQVKGTITDEAGNPLPFVSVFQENSYNSTTSNDQGVYQLTTNKTGNNKIVFQLLGFKTQKIAFQTEQLPLTLNVKMFEESFSLNEVIINPKNNPANAIIKSAIASKKENTKRTARYTADFYSRGIFKLKNAPKKIFGQKIGDMDGALDSTGTGIISLSETFSQITYEKPNHLSEVVIASKVSGNDKGYSYNTARSSFYDFYDNNVKFGVNMISPIADNAFNYYKYRLESTFVDENKQTVNKIKVSPKRDSEPVFEGYIYIVDDSYAIYAIDLNVKGYRMHEELIEIMTLKQNFSYNKSTGIWAKNTQSLDFTAGAFGIQFTGKFTYVYSNYEFKDTFAKNTFTNEITRIELNSNKKDSIFWNNKRPIPLTIEETKDYIRKDSIYKVRNSEKYLDSIDAKGNKFKLQSPITGYTFRNTAKRYSFNYNGLLDLSSLSFNSVQGFNFDSGFSFTKSGKEVVGTRTIVKTKVNYGFSDDRLRISGDLNHRFNTQNYASLSISGGTEVRQFNAYNPISNLINSTGSLLFKNNYMKLYNLEFGAIGYSQNIANGINFIGKVEYQQRKPLYNTTNYSFFKKEELYSSNNPIDPKDFINSGIENHSLIKGSVNTKITFGNKYITRPDGKLNISSTKFPTLFLSYEKAFGASDNKYDFDHISARTTYTTTLGNKGDFALNVVAGKFFNAENISFVDYKHFNGNQTYIGQSERYLNVFNLMPYYSNSTNKSYFEVHMEHNDNGFIMNKIPLLNKLKSTMVLGFHSLSTPATNPYVECSAGLDNLGFGKFKLFRVDYIRSYQNGFRGDGVVFGLKVLNVLD